MQGLERSRQYWWKVLSAAVQLDVTSHLTPASEVEGGSFPPSDACSRHTHPPTDEMRVGPKSRGRVGQCRILAWTHRRTSPSTHRGSSSTTSIHDEQLKLKQIYNYCVAVPYG